MASNLLSRLKEEYCQALVERMSRKEMRSYLVQIFANDVAFDSMEDMEKKITRIFDEEFFEQLLTDIALQSERSSTK